MGRAAKTPHAPATGAPDGVEVRTATAAAELDALGWRALVADADFFFLPEWLAFREGVPPRGAPAYFLAYDRGRLVAALPAFLYGDDAGPARYTRADLVLRAAATHARGWNPSWDDALCAVMPNLSCGAPQIGFSRPLFAPGVTPGARAAALDALLRHVERAGPELGAATTAFLYVDEDDEPLRASLRAHGYVEFDSDRRCELAVEWTSFDGYLAAFGHKRRYAIRRDERRLDEAGVVTEVVPLTAGLAPELAPLIANVDRKHTGVAQPDEDEEAALLDLVRRFGDRVVVSLARAQGAVRGFALFFRHGSRLFARDVGFDYEFQGKLPLYFAVLFYEPVRFALRERVGVVDYGVGSVGDKASRGCRVVRELGYLRSPDVTVTAAIEEMIAP